MTKTEKRALLDLIAAEQLSEVMIKVQEKITTAHPDHARITNLSRRFRELEERMEMGTLSKEDVSRLRSRIGGGLKDIIQEFRPLADLKTEAGEKEAERPTFKLALTEDPSAPDQVASVLNLGFFGEINCVGSPTKQETTLTLRKSYGASYHTCREAIRQAGMQMEKGDRDGGLLEASIAGTGVGSYGERILLWVTPLDAATTRVHVVVDSQLPTLAFDFGRNKQKLGILVSYLR